MISLTRLLDDAKCYEVLRGLRWPEGIKCPHCGSPGVTKQGMNAKQPQRQDYRHRGISQEKLPLYLGFFEFVHNARCRGKGLLEPMLCALLTGTR